jgi:hypothetical protein
VVDEDDDAMYEMDLLSHLSLLILSISVVDSVNYMMNHHNEILLFDIDDNL